MTELIETHAGVPTTLAATASDGREDLYLRAFIFDDSDSSPIAYVDLDHQSQGFYRASVTILAPGYYRAVYENFLDEERTTPDTDRAKDQDGILVHPVDPPQLGVVFDQTTNRLLIDITVSRNGAPMPADELTSAEVAIYDSDDHMLYLVSDLAPDTLGVFRFIKTSPRLIASRLYYAKATVVTTAGTVVANKGFQTTG